MRIKTVLLVAVPLFIIGCKKEPQDFRRELREIIFEHVPDRSNSGELWDSDGTPPDVYLYFSAVSDTGNSWHSAGMFENISPGTSQKYYAHIELRDEPWDFKLFDNDSHDYTQDQLMREWVINPGKSKEVYLGGNGYYIRLIFIDIPRD